MTAPTDTPASRPEHINRLIHATSPYLLQHAHNPVDWYPWGPEAFARAVREDKPVFLSIGYSACHWCHVMAHESFENPQIAEVLNRHFVSVKVDREERPDLDEIYMNATLVYNQGQGGWPMSVFLTPDQKPFFAGTYFPPERRWGRPGFRELLETIARLWREDRQSILRSADALTQAVRQLAGPNGTGEVIPPETVGRAVRALAGVFDRRHGGMSGGGTNKFPPSMAMSLMLREYRRSVREGRPDADLLGLIELTLDRMAAGGIYDHLGGGIARYSTDPHWLVPHFEKMLYDQALVAGIYLEAHQVTGAPRHAEVARGILDYVLADLRSPEGGFYSARDADSEGVEGRYYVWTKDEIMQSLGDRPGSLFCSYYDVTDEGNWEGRNILHVPRSAETVARLCGVTVEELSASLKASRARLLEIRCQRVPPGLDDKILSGWNGLMIAALARGGRVLGEPAYTRAAIDAAEFVLRRLSRDGRLLRTFRQGTAHTGGFLDDYAFVVDGLLELYETTLNWRWLAEARRLTDLMIACFWDAQGGAFYYTAHDAEELIVRGKDTRDGSIPSGNSVALSNLVKLAQLLDRDDYRDRAERIMRAFAASVSESPFGFERFLAGVDLYHAPLREVVIVGPPDSPDTAALIRVVHETDDPYRVTVAWDPAADDAEAVARLVPWVEGKQMLDGRPTAYVCRHYACQKPTADPVELHQQLRS